MIKIFISNYLRMFIIKELYYMAIVSMTSIASNTWARPVLMWCWWELSPALLWCPGLCCWGGSSSQPLQPCPGPTDLDTTWSLCPILPTPCPILLRCLSSPLGQTEPLTGTTLNPTQGCRTSTTAGECRRRSREGRRPWWEETPHQWRGLGHASPCLVWSY